MKSVLMMSRSGAASPGKPSAGDPFGITLIGNNLVMQGPMARPLRLPRQSGKNLVVTSEALALLQRKRLDRRSEQNGKRRKAMETTAAFSASFFRSGVSRTGNAERQWSLGGDSS